MYPTNTQTFKRLFIPKDFGFTEADINQDFDLHKQILKIYGLTIYKVSGTIYIVFEGTSSMLPKIHSTLS